MNKITGYTCIFSNLVLESSVWQEDKDVKLLWVTILALTDKDSMVKTSIPALARHAGLTLDECLKALEVLKRPDKYSNSKEHEGRRIIEKDGGLFVINHAKYRELAKLLNRREYLREAQAKYRARSKPSPKETAFVKAEEAGLHHISDHLTSPPSIIIN